MQPKIKLVSLVAASLIAGTAGAFAQGYDPYGPAWGPAGPGYQSAPPPVMYYPAPGPRFDPLNGSNHPTPSSTQGDVGPEGNNNGTLTGAYRYRYW